MKNFLIALLIFFQLLTLASCSSSDKQDAPNDNTIITSTETISTNISLSGKSHIDIQRSTGPGKEFLQIPMYFQQDFPDIPYKTGSIAEYGSLITCLSMLESYYSSKFITPDIYVSSHNVSDKFSDELLADFGQTNGRTLQKYPFNASTVASFLAEKRVVLLRISHPSIFGKSSAYILLTGTTENGMLCVRDPNKNNISSYATTLASGETLYDATTLCEQASASSQIYVFTETPNTQEDTKP